MRKANRTITVNMKIWDKFQELYPGQASSFVEDRMREALALKNGVSDIDVLQTKRELGEIIDNKNQLLAKENALRQKLELYNKKVQEIEQIKLEEKKQELESQITCDSCSDIVKHDKLMRYYDQKLCRGCFLSGNFKIKRDTHA